MLCIGFIVKVNRYSAFKRPYAMKSSPYAKLMRRDLAKISGFLVVLQLPDPNISVSHRIMMILKTQGLFHGVCNIFRGPVRRRGAFDLGIVLNQNPVLKYRNRARLQNLALYVELRSVVNNIVSLPFTRFAARVHQWGT